MKRYNTPHRSRVSTAVRTQLWNISNIARINHALESMPKQLAEAQTKLENVERQLETAKAEVNKPFAQEAELAENSALNALLNMDEKGDNAIGMDDALEEDNNNQDTSGHDVQKLGNEESISNKSGTEEKTADGPMPYPAGNTEQEFVAENRRPQGLKMADGMADKPVQKASLKEKLEAFKRKAAGIEKPDIGKAKGKEEML